MLLGAAADDFDAMYCSRMNTLLPISAFAPSRLCSRAMRSGSATKVTVTPMSREGQSLLHALDLLLTSFLYHSKLTYLVTFQMVHPTEYIFCLALSSSLFLYS
jgi:hypothetical protein